MKNKSLSRLCAMFGRPGVESVAVDADDTLWYDSRYFAVLRKAYLASCLSAGITHDTALGELVRHEKMVQSGDAGYCSAVLLAVQSLAPDERFVEEVERACQRFACRDIELLAGVRETLTAMQPLRISIVTKGNVQEQRRKIEQSMLQDLISDVQILQGKTVESWSKAFINIGCAPSRAIVIGNSIRHDIIPSVLLGASAIWFNHIENLNGRNGELPDQACEVSGWHQILKAVEMSRRLAASD